MHVGNDIVDLTDPETETRAIHPRFADRILDDRERTVLERDATPGRCLWRFWSAKESAFKALRKVREDARFLPRRLRVSLHAARAGEERRGVVTCDGWTVAVTIRESEDYVHAVAAAHPPGIAADFNSFERIESGVRRLPAGSGNAPFITPAGGQSGGVCPCPGTAPPSDAGRRFLVHHLAARLGCAPSALHVGRTARRGFPPAVTLHGKPVGADVSLSHHGRFVAFAFFLHEAVPAQATGHAVE